MNIERRTLLGGLLAVPAFVRVADGGVTPAPVVAVPSAAPAVPAPAPAVMPVPAPMSVPAIAAAAPVPR